MALFRKKRSWQEHTQTGDIEPGSPPAPATALDALRHWWHERTGEDPSPEMEDQLRQLTLAETRRLAVASAMLSPRQEEQAHTALKLGEAKMDNIGSLLSRTLRQQEWLARYNKLTRELREHTLRLDTLAKQLDSARDETDALSRYETFESIHEKFLNIRLLEKFSAQQKQPLAGAIAEMDTARQAETEERRKMALCARALEERERCTRAAGEQMEQVYHLQGERTILELDILSIRNFTDSLLQRQEATREEIRELEGEQDDIQKRLTELSGERADLEPHKTMLAQGRTLLFRIDMLSAAKEELDLVSAELKESTRRHEEENRTLESLSAQARDTEADIQVVNTKLQGHRSSIAVTDGRTLQERALRQTTLQQMLLSAQSHWAHIREGYQEIDETSTSILALRHQTDSLRQSLSELERELSPMQAECRDREHTLLVSASQKVAQLRGGLKEGTACAVCGAIHHPYHVSTPLEEKKLTDELRSAYESLLAEVETKQKRQAQMHDQLLSQETRQALLSDHLQKLKLRQGQLVKEWDIYAKLDASLTECSSATNMEARTGTIRQLMANAIRDAGEAQQELDSYNYHQSRIIALTEELSAKEREKSELSKRLASVNTNCQVLARHITYLTKWHTIAQTRFTSLYEELNRLVSLPDWMKTWTDSPEALKRQIAESLGRLSHCDEQQAELRRRGEMVSQALATAHDREAFIDSLLRHSQDSLSRHTDMLSEAEKNLARLLSDEQGSDGKGLLERSLRGQADASNQWKRQHSKFLSASIELARTRGRLEALQERGAMVEERLASQRFDLDVWISRYNASHPPVRFEELAATFNADTNWNDVRARTRQAQALVAAERMLVQFLQSEMLAMQALFSTASTSADGLNAEKLERQLEQLNKEYRDAALLTAESLVKLHRHQLCKDQLQQGNEAKD
ncbi:MAG: hypothetical protein LUC44_05175 [Prevotellaceae bacterium]|nr:hypothetical protein [Prevotellaceae bacterium]